MNRRRLLATAALAAASAPLLAQGARSVRPLTLLVAHGAWSAGWSWKKMHPLMAAAGHRLITPTYTGLGEREHLATRETDLETHVQDLLGVIKYEQLDNFVERFVEQEYAPQHAAFCFQALRWEFFGQI